MKILFTGASSFTGFWFAKELANSGHDVTACMRRPYSAYSGLRKKRIDLLNGICSLIFDCPFGSPAFINLIDAAPHWDLLCHHAAEVANYKSADFDVAAALANNTYNLQKILHHLQNKGCSKILLTGSVFEQNEGFSCDDEQRAVSPYGLSKGLTTDFFRYYAEMAKMKLGKFVIPNPFGPYEEARFTTYLIKSWHQGLTPSVNTPEYVRDNIHASLLAIAYRSFAEGLTHGRGFEKFNPSFYQETQSAFTERFAREMRSRLSLPCHFEIKKQTDFIEPLSRVNMNPLDVGRFNWKEEHAWDELAEYYAQTILKEEI